MKKGLDELVCVRIRCAVLSRLAFRQLHKRRFHIHCFRLEHPHASPGLDERRMQIFDRQLIFVKPDRDAVNLLIDFFHTVD